MEKKWDVFCSYEPNRLADNNLSESYEALLQKNKCKISSGKKIEATAGIQYLKELQQGNLK